MITRINGGGSEGYGLLAPSCDSQPNGSNNGLYASANRTFFNENNTQISDVVTYHLAIEGLLERMLVRNLADPSALDFERIMFVQKLRLVRALGMIEGPLFDVVRKMNPLRNEFVHKMGFSPRFEDIHALVVEAGRADVDFTDGVDAADLTYARSLDYDSTKLLDTVFRNVFYAMAWAQGDDFWRDVLA